MRISDWSSDVCSSDLAGDHVGQAAEDLLQPVMRFDRDLGAEAAAGEVGRPVGVASGIEPQQVDHARPRGAHEFERLQCIVGDRSEEHTSELQSLMRNSYAVFRLQNNTSKTTYHSLPHT